MNHPTASGQGTARIIHLALLAGALLSLAVLAALRRVLPPGEFRPAGVLR